jgi:hypothetical protein
MENKKLALDKFIEGIIKIKIPINGQTQDELFELYYKCKEIEKEQIKKAFEEGICYDDEFCYSSEDYYNDLINE